MRRIILLFCVTMIAFTGCPNQQQLEHATSLAKPVYASSLPEHPLIEQDGKFIPLVAPVGCTEETILMKFTDSTEKPQWTMQDSMKNVSLDLSVLGTVGFGKLKNGDYAISFQVGPTWRDWKEMWLHVSVGTEIDGKLEEGVLLDIFGNRLTVTGIKFTFLKDALPETPLSGGSPVSENPTPSHARAKIVKVEADKTLAGPLFTMNARCLRTRLKLEISAQDENGRPRTFTRTIEKFGVHSNKRTFDSVDMMFGGW